jgi:hypothetical protein
MTTVVGVDFSGAAQSGKTAWLAELQAENPLRLGDDSPRFRLNSLQRLGKLAGGDERETVNAYLVDRISTSGETFWGCDFPFGLPIELPIGLPIGPPQGVWQDQLSHASGFRGSAKDFGRELVKMTERELGTKHVRRRTDRETQTPFDCYHYRIIYQTFHGMRDVLAKIAGQSSVCVLPFQYAKLKRPGTASIILEACPSSTLKRLRLPHQRYKQSGGKPPEGSHKQVRGVIMKKLLEYVEISPHRRRVIMNNPGGDALDAVLAGVGSWLGYAAADHRAIAQHDRYPREGFVYC